MADYCNTEMINGLDEKPVMQTDTAPSSVTIDQVFESHHATRLRTILNIRTKKEPFEFKATHSSDVIENPFRYYNSWHMQTRYHSSIQDALTKDFQGNPLHVLLWKLKTAKAALKSWWKNKYNIHQVIVQFKEEANQIYNQLVTDSLNEDLIKQYTSKTDQI